MSTSAEQPSAMQPMTGSESHAAELQALDAKWESCFEALMLIIKDIVADKKTDKKGSADKPRLHCSNEPEMSGQGDRESHGTKRKPADKGKGPALKKHATGPEPESDEGTDSDREIHDDAVSLPDTDMDLLNELDNDLDDEKETSDNIAESLANIVNKSFW